MTVQIPVSPPAGSVESSTRDDVRDTPKTRKPKRFMVIVENDEFHTFPYVIEVLRSVCGHNRRQAYRLTNQVHFHGQAVVWIGPLEHAEMKSNMIRAFGPDQFAREQVSMPLGVRIERFDDE